MTAAVEKEKQSAWLSAVPEQNGGKKRQHFLPSVEEVAPNGNMVSEQPEISELARLKKDLHTLNAQRGTAFASQSERASLSHRKQSSVARKPAESDDIADSDTEQQEEEEENIDSDADSENSSVVSVQKDVGLKRHFSPQPHMSPQTVGSKKKVSLAETHTTVPITPTKKTDSEEKKDQTPWFQRMQGFFKKNIMVVLALVVLLIFCGVSVYLFIKTKIETKKRDAERAEMQVVIEQEQALPRRDAALEQLRAEKAALQITNEQTRATLEAYAKQLQEAKEQSEQQMDMLEQLAYLNQQYEQHIEEQTQTLARQQEEYDALMANMNQQPDDQSATEEEAAHSEAPVVQESVVQESDAAHENID